MLRSTALRSAAVLMTVMLLVAGCGRDTDADNIAASMGFDPSGPIPTLPDCTDEPVDEVEVGAAVRGVLLPDGAIVTRVTEIGPVTQVSAEVAMTPVAVREDYEARDDAVLYASEDEVFEAELLLGYDDAHVHVLALALCREGSAIDLNIAPAGEEPDIDELGGPGYTSTPRKREPVGADGR